MGILDRYIARQYLVNVLALLAIMGAFVVAVDVSLNFDEFWSVAREHARVGDASGSLLRRALLAVMLVFDFWWPRLLQLYNYLIGLVLIGAMGFTLTQLVRHRELVAAVAGGVSLYRVARPVMLVALAFTAFQVANHELILPRIADLLTRQHDQASRRALAATPVKLVADSQRRLFHATAFDPDAGVLEGVYIIERDEGGLTTRTIAAPRAAWQDGAWVLESPRIRLRGTSETAPANGTAASAVRLPSDLDPTALKIAKFSGYSQNLSWRQIGQMLERPDLLRDSATETESGRGSLARADELQRIRYGRIGVIACNLLALAVSLPFFLRREPANMLVQSLKCAPLAIGGVMAGVFGSTADIPGLPPMLSVFVPAVVLAPLAIASLTSVRT